MKHSGSADLPLHYGHVPKWLSERMARLGIAITESVLTEYGSAEVLRRLSDPFWFQSFGAVLGMDWHSSGITTSVLGALKSVVNPRSKEMGLYICGGKGLHSRQTPDELMRIADTTGLNGDELVHCSRLSAKVDNNAIQDGFQLYTHNFILNSAGQWTVIQQGMHATNKTARRYHWHSSNIKSFVETPHTGICGVNQGDILNLTADEAQITRDGMMQVTNDQGITINVIQRLIMPAHHHVAESDVNLKRLGTVLWLAREKQFKNFEDLLLLHGVGARTIQSLALVSEVIHGSPSRFKDPARFSFAHGGKDGHPFPVPTKIYDETISILETSVQKAKLSETDKASAIRKLHEIAVRSENNFVPNDHFQAVIRKEKDESWRYDGRTVSGHAKPPANIKKNGQLKLF